MTSLPIVGGITACGIFLLMISVIGLIGAVRHNQVTGLIIIRIIIIVSIIIIVIVITIVVIVIIIICNYKV